jgi:hypothetical protein
MKAANKALHATTKSKNKRGGQQRHLVNKEIKLDSFGRRVNQTDDAAIKEIEQPQSLQFVAFQPQQQTQTEIRRWSRVQHRCFNRRLFKRQQRRLAASAAQEVARLESKTQRNTTILMQQSKMSKSTKNPPH